MTTVNDVFEFLRREAPLELKMDSDNVGLLVGEPGGHVEKVLVSLDITSEVIDEAVELGARLIVSHHPLFFSLKRVADDEIEGRKIIKLIKNGIAAICMHTNLDAVAGGVNDYLAQSLRLTDTEILAPMGTDVNGNGYGMGRVGVLPEPVDFKVFLNDVKRALAADGLRYAYAGRPVKKVAVGGGTCGDYLGKAISMGCDTFVTADIKHSIFISAREYGVNLIDAGHFNTEDVVCPTLVERISRAFPALDVKKSARHRAPMEFYVDAT